MGIKQEIELNFLDFQQQKFNFKVYIKEFKGEQKENFNNKNIIKHKLPENNSKNDNWKDYWILFEPTPNFEEFNCNAQLNPYLTLHFVYLKILQKIVSEDIKIVQEKSFRKKINIIISTHDEGHETIWIEPYFLKSENKFGILLDYEFKKNKEYSFSKKIQKLSLSLNKYYGINKDYYIDKYDKIIPFIKNIIKKIFPININNEGVLIVTECPAPPLT